MDSRRKLNALLLQGLLCIVYWSAVLLLSTVKGSMHYGWTQSNLHSSLVDCAL